MASSAAGLGPALAFASAGCFGFNIAYARLASFAGVTGTTLVFYRVFLMLALAAAATFLLRHSLRIVAGETRALVVFSVATTAVGVAYLSSVAFIPVTVAVVIFYTFPVLIVLASPFVEGRPLNSRLLAIAAFAFAGIVLVIGPAFGAIDIRGLGLAALASVAAATQFFAAARCPRTGIAAKVLWIHVLVLPVTALIGLVTGALSPPGDLLLAPFAVAMTIGGYVVGFVLQMAALARSSAVAAGLAFCFEPVAAAIGAAIVLGESLSAVQWAGGALVLAAIIINVLLQRRPEPAAPSPLGTAAS